MPINVTHDVDPRALAAAAYRIGRGGAYLRERKRYDDREQEWYNRQSDDYNRQWQQYQNEQQLRQQEYANQFSQEQEQARRAESERNFYEPSYADQQRSEEFAATLRDNRAYRDQQIDFQQHQEKMRTQAKQREVEAKLGGKFQYTPEQESQRNDLLSRRQNVVSMAVRGEILPEERDQALTQIDAEIDSIQPEFQPNQGPSAQDTFNESVVTDQETGMRFLHTPGTNGTYKFEPIEDKNALKAKVDEEKKRVELEHQKAKLDLDLKIKAMEQARKALTVKDDNGKEVAPDPQAVNNLAGQIYESSKQFISFDPAMAQQEAMSYLQGGAQEDMGAQQNDQARQRLLEIERLGQEAVQRGDRETYYALKAERDALLAQGM